MALTRPSRGFIAFMIAGFISLAGTRLLTPVSAQSEYNCLMRLEPMDDLYEGSPFDPGQFEYPITTATRFDLNILTNEFTQTTLFEPEGQVAPYPLFGELSPDGVHMAYWGAKDEDHLFLAISEPRNFTADNQATFAVWFADQTRSQPGWSADSRYFAVLSETEAGITAMIYEPDLKLVALRSMPSRFVGWSYSGHELITIAAPGENRPTLDIYHFDPEQNISTVFTVADAADFTYPFWLQSSNRNWLVLYSPDGLGFYDRAAGTFQQVNSYRLAMSHGYIMSPQWSSDNHALIYQEHNPEGEPEFGGFDDLVAFIPETGDSQVLIRHMANVEFSPDRHYAFVGYIREDNNRTSALIDLTTLETVQVFTGKALIPTWTEDSRFLVLEPYQGSIDGIRWVDTRDNTVHEVNNLNTLGFRIDDIAASRWLTFHNQPVIDRNNVVTGQDSTQIGILDLQTGDFQLVDQPQIQLATFSPDGQTLTLLQSIADETLRVTLLMRDGTVAAVLDLPVHRDWIGNVIWSPDSSQFALYLREMPYPIPPRELYVFGADGSQRLHRTSLPDYFYLDQWTTCHA